MQIFHDRFVVCFDTRFLFLCAGGILFLPLKWLLGFVIAVFVHEMAHYVALLLLGVKIYTVEIGGSGIIMRTEILSNRQEFVCAMSGPVGGLLFMLITYRIPYMSVCAFVQSLYNLLPLGDLDGGRALKCLLAGYLSEQHSNSVFRICEIITRIILCVLLCFVAAVTANTWIRLLLILIVCRLCRQKFLAKKRNQ